MEPAQDESLCYEVTARRDWLLWVLLLSALVFAYAGWTVDPASNCSEDGSECAPWLVYVAKFMGTLLSVRFVIALLRNPSRGSRIDPQTGELIWWHASHIKGRIHPTAIGVIRVRRNSDGEVLSLYSLRGEQQFGFTDSVVPKPIERWARTMSERWPHIVIEILEA
jgi:hypothetical protein